MDGSYRLRKGPSLMPVAVSVSIGLRGEDSGWGHVEMCRSLTGNFTIGEPFIVTDDTLKVIQWDRKRKRSRTRFYVQQKDGLVVAGQHRSY